MPKIFRRNGKRRDNITDAVSAEAVDLAHNIGAKYSGSNLLRLRRQNDRRYRPVQRIIAMTPNEKVASQLL